LNANVFETFEAFLARREKLLDALPRGGNFRFAPGPERTRNRNLLRFAGPFLDRGNVENAVGIQAHPAEYLVLVLGAGQAFDVEIAHENVVQSVFVFALKDLDIHASLSGIARVIALGASYR